MAGYNQREVEKFREALKDYEEIYIPGYKAVKNFKGKPLIQYTLENIEGVDAITEVVIVGHKNQLEDRLSDFLARTQKKYIIVSQSEDLGDLVEEFGVDPEIVAKDSLAGNGLKAYAKTEAYRKREYGLFFACDSPLTTSKQIEQSIKIFDKYISKYPLIYPFVSMKEKMWLGKAIHRKYFFLVNDSEFQFDNSFRTWKTNREGFRPSFMICLNPFSFDVNMINVAYGLRKLWSKPIREQLKAELEKHGHGDKWDKYFKTKDLSIRDCERIITDSFKGELIIIPTRDVKSSYDYDGTEGEEEFINFHLGES